MSDDWDVNPLAPETTKIFKGITTQTLRGADITDSLIMEKECRILSDSEARVVVECSQGLKTFDLVDVHTEPWSSEPVGCCGKHLRVTIAIKLHTGEDSVQQFFAKSIPYSKELKPRELVEYLQLFRSEFLFFGEILPAFGGDSEPFTPRCFLSREDLLVMEDLSREGYSSPATRDLMSYDDCVATLRSLARLHAASLAFEERHPERKTVLESWPDAFPAQTESVGDDYWLATGLKTLEFLTDIVPEVDDREALKSLFTQKRKDIMNVHNDLRKASSRYRNVLSHGDLYSSNTLIKRSADGHQVVDVKLIDFQVLCYAPMAYDVTFFLHQVSDRKFRNQYLDSLLTTYYKYLSESLKGYNIDVKNIQTFHDFLESCKVTRSHAIISAALYYPLVMLDTPYLKQILSSQQKFYEFKNVDRTQYVMKSLEKDELYRLRICDTFREYIDWFSDNYK